MVAALTFRSFDWTAGGGGVLVLAGAVLLYVASRAAADALAGGDPGRAGWRAAGHFVPIAMTAVAAAILNRPDLALGVVFATSVASLSLVLGIVTYLEPPRELPASRRVWSFVLPAALLPLVAGFSGQLSWLHALMMAIFGGAVLSVWTERRPTSLLEDGSDARRAVGTEGGTAAKPFLRVGWLQLILALIVAALGGYAATRGAVRAANMTRGLTIGAIASTVISPLLTLPLLATGSVMAQRGRTSSVFSTAVALVLLNLCVLIPIVALSGYVVPGAWAHFAPEPPATVADAGPTTAPTTRTDRDAVTQTTTVPVTRPAPPPAPSSLFGSIVEHGGPVRYPLAVWRIDNVILVVLGFALIPVAQARWSLSRFEGGVIIVGYAAYLAMTTYFAGRFG